MKLVWWTFRANMNEVGGVRSDVKECVEKEGE